MKHTHLIAIFGCLAAGFLAGCASSSPDLTKYTPSSGNAKTSSVSAGALFRVKTTAYSHMEKDHKTYGRGSATGNALLAGRVRSAAADWSMFPVGTIFRIKGDSSTYVVDDYGRALVGTKTIDIYKPTLGEVRAWGSRNVNIEVVRWGSYSRSLDILSDRKSHPHVRAMISSILRKTTGKVSASAR
jgi:3D (Asp-Asp-Asp) domain-containing protein